MERKRWGDAILAVGASLGHVLAWLASAVDHPKHPLWTNLLVLCLPTLPLFWRRTRPMTTFVAVAAGYLVWHYVAAPDMRGQIAFLFVAVALYEVARRVPPPLSLGPAAVAAVLLALPDLAASVFLLAIPAGVWFLGWTQRRLIAERELNARLAVEAERHRISRDLHDSVAHHVSAIAVLARTAEVVFDEDPAAVRAGLGLLGGTADAALADMRRLIAAETADNDLDALTHPLKAAGYDVTVEGDAAPVDATTYRVVQEGLANVMKHVGPTRVRIILIENDAAPKRSLGGSGRGLSGVRERAAINGGTVEAGAREDGGWRLRVTLRR